MKKALFFAISLVFVLVTSCDKIDAPYGNTPVSPVPGDTEVVMRKILIEDFTGQTCGNCPRAAESLTLVHNLYGDKMVAIAVHAGFFADPAGTHYPNDYRTATGNELDQYFGNSAAGLPNGLINRKEFDGQSIVQHTAWASKATELLALPVEAFMWITPSYSATNRNLSVSVRTKILQNIDEGVSLVLYLTEDSVLSSQKDYDLPSPSLIEVYTHRHMLRGSINGTWGAVLSPASVYAIGEEFITTGSYTIPAEWNSDHVGVVAVLYRTATKEVIQAEDQEITE